MSDQTTLAMPREQLQQRMASDPIVWRDDLLSVLRVSGQTLRRWLKEGKLPKPDIHPTRKCMAWRLSTLREAGFEIAPELEPTEAQT